LVSDIPAGDGKLVNLFLTVCVDFSAVEYYAVSISMDPVFPSIPKFTNKNHFLNSDKPSPCLCPLFPNLGSFMSSFGLDLI
jgi:hypothetical protein